MAFDYLYLMSPVFYRNRVEAQFDSASENVQSIMCLPASGTITKIDVYCSSIEGTAPEYQVRLETVSSLQRSTTLWAANTSATFTPSVGLNSITLDSSATVSAGDLVAAVIIHNSGTINVSNNASYVIAMQHRIYDLPVNYHTTTKRAGFSCVCPVYSDGSYPTFAGIAGSKLDETFNNSSSREIGSIFTPTRTVDCSGIVWGGRLISTSSNVELRLYDSTPTLLASVEYRGNQILAVVDGTNDDLLHFGFFDTQTLLAGNTYYTVIAPTTANNIEVALISNSNEETSASLFGGLKYSERSGGAFSAADATKQAFVQPLLTAND